MNSLNTPSDTLTLESIEAQLQSLAANLSGDVGFDDLELRHLLDILSKSTLLLREGYDAETLDRIRWGEGRPAEFLGADLRSRGDISGSRLFRLWSVPDVLRNYGDKCLYDVGLAGRTTFRGVALEDLGPRAYNLAGQVLELLADDRMLRKFFEHNTMECLPIDREGDRYVYRVETT